MLNLAEFRLRRDYFQWLRREQVLPDLKTRESALKREIDAFYKKLEHAPKRDKQLIETAMRPLQWEYQYVAGQIAVIESEHESLSARVPAHWKAQVFEIATVADSEAA